MLPPISNSLLEQNPKFKALYKDLSTNKLNADCTTKNPKRQWVLQELGKKLTKARNEAAERTILTDGLYAISMNATDLPVELREVVQIVCAQLSDAIPPEDHEILEDDVEYFLENIDLISTALAAYFDTTTAQLLRIADPTADPSTTTLSTVAQSHLTTNTSLTTALLASTAALTALLTTILTTHTALLSALLRPLEQTLHGAVSRHTRAHAEHLAAVTRGMQLKLQIVAHPKSLGGDEELAAALGAYVTSLGKRRTELVARRTGAERVLREYEAGGEGMRGLVGRWVALKAEEGRVRGEIERLERREGES